MCVFELTSHVANAESLARSLIMLDLYKTSTTNQFEAALCTIQLCINKCPDESWNEPICNVKFCQVAFHTLFFADIYCGIGDNDFREQPFHLENRDFFGLYEELSDSHPVQLYQRDALTQYVEYCRQRAKVAIQAETIESLSGPSHISWRPESRAELHPYNIRHIQHHAAQLSLRLRLDHGIDVPWVSSGWKAELLEG